MITTLHGIDPNTPVARLCAAYDDRFAAARDWQSNGGKVVGYVSTAVPAELIAAAGMFPLLITGDTHRTPTLASEWMEEQFDPAAQSIFDSALAGELAFLDLLIVPRVADSFVRLYLYLREVERLGIAKRLPQIVLFDLLQTHHFSSANYNRERFSLLRQTLGNISGKPILDDHLRAAIAAANTAKRVTSELIDWRREERIAGSLAQRLLGARYFLETRDYASLLRQTLRAGVPQPQRGLPRIVIAGNAQESVELHELCEARGFAIVGDYHWLGEPTLCAVSTADDPAFALVDHYHYDVLTSRRFPHRPDEIVQFARAARADGVIIYLYEQEEALTWDAPHQVRALEHAGIAALVLDNQPYRPTASKALLASLASFGSRLRVQSEDGGNA